MITTDTIQKTRAIRWSRPHISWGLVPTMGYLHEGHLSLVKRARAENDCVAVTIYVNPTQFAAHEDLSTYPRDIERDLALLAAEGVDLVFLPSTASMYPAGYQTWVSVNDLTQRLEGASRPSHFRGVTTIVTKLFNIIQPTRAYFGQKDAQQTVVIKRMVQDLNINTEVIICPTVREEDGLAMSSRNKYLTPEQRVAATVLNRALKAAERELNNGEQNSDAICNLMEAIIDAVPQGELEYVSVADLNTLKEIDVIEDSALISLAVRFGDTRLIDNIMWRLAT